MKTSPMGTNRIHWLMIIGVALVIYLCFFLMAISSFIDRKNEKIVRKNNEKLESLKGQIASLQRAKAYESVPSREFTPNIPNGFSKTYSVHFTIYSFNNQLLEELAPKMEKIYNAIIADTNLYNFNPPERFEIYIYKDVQMYKENTKRAEWSGGFVFDRKMYTFEGPHLDYILPHEATHLIFNDFMQGKATKISVWVNEGLAMYEENKNSNIKKYEFDKSKRMEMPEFLTLNLYTAPVKKVEIWYAQAESLITFMLEKRAKTNFYNFLATLRETENLDSALFLGYQSEFQTIYDLEKAWLKD
ncbi:MAG: hypothetical protein JW983_08285 [Elusimicrobia bacterium]|nr:hypothetical protein [Elusimicrobiota bacterium]